MIVKPKTALIIGGSVIGLTAGVILYNKYRKKQRMQSQIKAVTTGTSKTLGINIPEIASQLGIELGYAYPKYDPRSWTENDTEAKELILKVPKPLIPTLINEYLKKYKRNLVDDLQKSLDGWNDVKYLFT